MTAKSRECRKVKRAWARFNNNLKNGLGYDKDLLLLQLRAMHLSRKFNRKYPRQLPKLTYKYKSNLQAVTTEEIESHRCKAYKQII